MEIATQCTLDCPDSCTLLCSDEGGHLTLRGHPDRPTTEGFTCAKIRNHPDRLSSPHRIREPWIRRGDRFHRVSWNEALSLAAERLSAALAADPASALLLRGYGSMGASKGYVSYVFERLGARATRGSLCDGAGIAAIVEDAGALDMNHPGSIGRAEAIVLWGKNPRASSIHTAARVQTARKRGVPVLGVTVDRASLDGLADDIIVVRPGCDRFLALAAAKIFLETQAERVDWERAAGGHEFRRLLDAHPLETYCRAADVTPDDAIRVAAFYARKPNTATIAAWGMQRYRHGAENIRAVHALAFLAGNLGAAGGGFHYNIPSSRHLKRPRAESAAEPLLLPRLAEELGRSDPPVRFAWVCGMNPANQCPDAKGVREALEKVETVVVADGFWTDTARLADIVLPVALWLEEEDLAGSAFWNSVGAVRRVVAPPPGCRTDFEIAHELAARLGLSTGFDDVDSWLAACLPEGVSLEAVREKGWVDLPHPEVPWENGFAHPDGKYRLPARCSPEPEAEIRYPFTLLTHVRADALHSQILPEMQAAPLPVRMHPSAAEPMGLRSGDPVRVVSRTGEIEGKVRLDPGLHPDCVAVPRGGWSQLDRGVNDATEAIVSASGETAAFYQTRVRLESATHRGRE